MIPAREAQDALRDTALALLEHRHGPPETGNGRPDRDFVETLSLTVHRQGRAPTEAAPVSSTSGG